MHRLWIHRCLSPPIHHPKQKGLSTHIYSFLRLWQAHSWHPLRHLGRCPRPRKLENLRNCWEHGSGLSDAGGRAVVVGGGTELREPAWGPKPEACAGPTCMRPWWRWLELQACVQGYSDVDFAGFGFDEAERASSEECGPVCTRKPKPYPRGGARRLAERPHPTWADTASGTGPGRVGTGGGLGPAHCFPTCARVGCSEPDPERGEGETGGFRRGVHQPAPGGRCPDSPSKALAKILRTHTF
jgi:hypothetical protein